MMTTSIRLLSDGTLKRDGGTMFGQIPKMTWENRIVTDRRNRMTLSMNCLLIHIFYHHRLFGMYSAKTPSATCSVESTCVNTGSLKI